LGRHGIVIRAAAQPARERGGVSTMDQASHVERPEESAERVWHALLRATSSVRAEMRKEFARRDLTGAQWGLIRVLGDAGPEGVMLSDISERLLVSCGNTTGIVDRLEDAGYVVRTPHPQDRRAILAKLSDRGRELYLQLAPVLRQRAASLLGHLTPAERASLIALLTRIADQVTAAPDN
jgi:DNA-binding MarR family transcriptional regulator